MFVATDAGPRGPAPARRDRGGPPLVVPAVVLAGLTVAGAVIGGAGPRPGSSPTEVVAHLAAHPTAASIGAFLLLGSAFPLVVYAATAVRRLQGLGVQVPGPVMGLSGAVLAAGALIVSALAYWTAVQAVDPGEPGIARVLTTLWFAAGGVGFVGPFGLLVLGLAIPVLVMRLVPRPLARAGVVVGVLAVLSSVGMVTELAYPLLPVGRFGGLLFLLALAIALPARRDTTGRP